MLLPKAAVVGVWHYTNFDRRCVGWLKVRINEIKYNTTSSVPRLWLWARSAETVSIVPCASSTQCQQQLRSFKKAYWVVNRNRGHKESGTKRSIKSAGNCWIPVRIGRTEMLMDQVTIQFLDRSNKHVYPVPSRSKASLSDTTAMLVSHSVLNAPEKSVALKCNTIVVINAVNLISKEGIFSNAWDGFKRSKN